MLFLQGKIRSKKIQLNGRFFILIILENQYLIQF
jgi:hypothetical protein